jgi:hypothetical protein
MIKLKLNPYGSKESNYDFDGRDAYSQFEKVLLKEGIHHDVHDAFHILYNGKILDAELAKKVKPTGDDTLLICPKIKGGSFGETFKLIATIAVAAVVAPAVASSIGAAGWKGALVAAAVTITASLLLNALIPPPEPGLPTLGGLPDNLDNSQMFAITGQSNRTQQYGSVPRVYGTFNMFPNVVAQPYTNIEVDPSTGELVQVLYALYDFGFGPNLISDLKIGETPIENFQDIEYRYVDPNKPLIDEGPWDTQVNPSFQIYKGDVELQEIATVINKNREGSYEVGDVSDYRVIRNGPINPDLANQEISLTITYPRGLFSFSNRGNRGNATVEWEIEFAEIGTENWFAYNDTSQVFDFKTVGGNAFVTEARSVPAFSLDPADGYSQIGLPYSQGFSGFGESRSTTTTNYGYLKGSNTIRTTVDVQPNTKITFDGTFLGNAVSSVTVSNGFEITLDTPLANDIYVFRRVQQTRRNNETGDTSTSDSLQGSTGRISVEFSPLKKAFAQAATQKQYYSQITFKPRTPGEYKIRVTRIRSDFTYGNQRIADATWIDLRTRLETNTINTKFRHTFLEIKVRATNQINGNLDNISAIVQGIIPIYNQVSGQWELGATSNPAWIFADLLTGDVNKRAVDKSRLDLDSLQEWADYADEIPVTPSGQPRPFDTPRFTCNFILDFSTSLKALLQNIGGSCQASLNIVDGKYGVLIDRLRTVPVQVFTPRNYSNFNSRRAYVATAEALKVRYNEPTENYKLTERIVYNDGFDETNLTKEPEELKTFGVTDSDMAWRFGRYMLAQATLRQETIGIEVDFENLVCTRGDYVQFTQDSMRVGGRPARVSSVVGNRITIDDGIDTVVGPTYGYVFRNPNGIFESTLTPVSSDTFDLDGDIPNKGDLIVIGEVDQIVFDCIVTAISPVDDTRASITLVEKADGVFTSLETGTIPNYNPQINSSADISGEPPGEVSNLDIIETGFTVGEGRFDYFVRLGWQNPTTGGIAEAYEVYVNRGEGFELVDVVREVGYDYTVDNAFLGTEHCFKVLAVSSGGRKINLGEVGTECTTPERKITPPADVEELNINITNQVIGLDWTLLPPSEGIQNYFIRFNPTLEGTWDTAIPLVTADSTTSSASVQGRRGTYLIKAVDFEGNESATATKAVTSIPELFDLNIVENINDAPTWNGVFDRTEIVNGDIHLRKDGLGNYYNEGFYYFESPLNLGENYTVRLQSLVEAGSYTEADLMVNWIPLASITAMATSTNADWNVETQVRYTDRINFIESWQPLSDVVSMSEGDIDNWQPYVTFNNGDFTARIFQLRLRLTSLNIGVTPRVIDGLVKADMPDRIEDGNNIVSDIAGTDIVYDPPFYGPGTTPSIQISQDTAQTGDYYVLTNKTLDGFTITFYDSTNAAVSRQFDYQVKGYGRKNDTFI